MSRAPRNSAHFADPNHPLKISLNSPRASLARAAAVNEALTRLAGARLQALRDEALP